MERADQLVSVIGLEDISSESGRAMLGFWVTSDATGRGIGRRAIALAIDWALAHSQLCVIWAIVADANLPSRRVLEANGFRVVRARGVDERGDSTSIYELELRA